MLLIVLGGADDGEMYYGVCKSGIALSQLNVIVCAFSFFFFFTYYPDLQVSTK
jgi:hypothetical protein